MAKLNTKRAPVVTVEGMERIIQQIYDDINDIIRAINSQSSGDEIQGRIGDIKVVVEDQNVYKLKVKTNEGWAEANITFIEK
tara:strand:+ start:990 stop:1235 length:246 start_codon:yes stop_codon:yes gene_type:complete